MEEFDYAEQLQSEYEVLEKERQELFNKYKDVESKCIAKKDLLDLAKLIKFSPSLCVKSICKDYERYFKVLEIDGNKIKYLRVCKETIFAGMSSIDIKIATTTLEIFAGMYCEPDTEIHFLEVYAEALKEIPKLPGADEY